MAFAAEGSPEGGNPTFIRAVPFCILSGKEDFCRPARVAIGPYHHENENLRPMEAFKAALIENSPGFRRVEAEVSDLLPEMLSFYPPVVTNRLRNNFEEMVVKDAFFVVFICLCQIRFSLGLDRANSFGIGDFDSSILRSCVRDLFVADNQLPWAIVDRVSSLVVGGEREGRIVINAFLSTLMSGNLSTTVPDDLFDDHPLHLLDLLRRRYLVDYKYPKEDGFVLYSAKELLARGVKIVEAVPGKEIDCWVGGVSFSWKTATLALPHLTVSEYFEHTFLNMAAHEAIPGISNNGEITKFLCLFRGLLRDQESVAIMREKFISSEGNDEMIMELFNGMCQNLHPDFLVYKVFSEDQVSRDQFYLARWLEVWGVIAAFKKAMAWGRMLYRIYLNHQMPIETLLGAAMMLVLRQALGA